MKTYTLKWASTYNYNLYDGATLVTDADLATLFGSAGEAYFVFDFNGSTPSNLTRMGILNSSNTVIISKTGLGTGAVKENYRFKGTWAAGATTFTTFAQLQGHTLDEYQLGVIAGKIKDAGKAESGAGAPTTSTAGKYIGQLYLDTTNDDLYYLSVITPQGTDPETYEYTWEAVGGGIVTTAKIADGAVTAAKIDFTTFTPDWTLLNDEYGFRYRKVGAMVELDISAYSDDGIALTSGISVDLGTLPAAYRPSRSYRFAVWGYRSSSSTSQMLSISVQSSGVVQLVYWGAGGTYQQIGGHGTFAV